MSSAILTLGFASRTEAVLALRKQGLTTHAIAGKIGIEPKSVTALEASARRRGVRAARDLPAWNAVAIDDDVLRALRPKAAQRGISVTTLARQLLAAIAADDMVDAVLDDAFRSEFA